MSKRRLLFYNDARHYHIYCYEPPISLDDARAPVDEIAGTRVDTLVYGFGAGPTMMHLTEVGEVWGTRIETFKDMSGVHRATLPNWRAYENIKSLKERGLDILNVLIERAHEKGLEFFGSLRMNHLSDPTAVDDPHNWQFKIDHPEWCLQGRGKHNFNWAYPEVRAERFALIEEAVNRYDMDGFEVDWLLRPFYFEEGEVESNTHILTEFMRDVRRVTNEAADKRGRPIPLGARVLPTLSGNLAAGLDVHAWIKERLLDFVVPNFYIDHQIDSDFPFEWLVDLASPAGCKVYPALQSRVGRPLEYDVEFEGQHDATPAHYYAGAAAYWSKGADGIYLPWFKWPLGSEQRQILCEIQDPDLLREKPKHHVVRGHDEDAASHGYTAQLPLTLTAGLDAPGQTVHLFTADDNERVDTLLKLRLSFTTSHDSMTVSLNGEALSNETCRRTLQGVPSHAGHIGTYSYIYTWLEYPLARGALRKGRNEVGVALHSRPPNLTGKVVLDRVDLVVTYPAPKAARILPV